MVGGASQLHLSAREFQVLFTRLGPSLGVWRAAEIAMLRTQTYEAPVLDLGCGDGIVTSLVLDRVDIGVDPSRAALARAATLNLYDCLMAEPIEAAAIPDASVGTVISNSVLEHVPD